MRLIDADALMDIYAMHEFASDMGDAMEILDHAQTIDAVPVIRCKDCKWNEGGEWVDCYMSGMHGRTSTKNYCSRAERKEE